jgi:O-antigen ligase
MKNDFFYFFEKYGLLLILLNCYALLPPDLSQKVSMMELDLNSFNEGQSGSSIKKQLLWIVPLFIYAFSFLRTVKKVHFNKKSHAINIIIITLLFIISLSFIYNYNLLSLKRAIFQVVLILVIGLAVYFSVKHGTLVTVIDTFCVFVIFTCLISIMLGTGFTGNTFSAWAKTKNQLGSYLMSASILFVFVKQVYKCEVNYYKLKVLMMFMLLAATVSKTALFVLITSFILFKLNTYTLKIIFNSIAIAILCVFLVIPGIADLTGDTWNIAQFMDPDTLTGRGLIWSILYRDLNYNDLLWSGYGLASYFSTGVIPAALDDPYSFVRFLNSAHNGYLELLLQFGILITLIVTLLLLRIVNLINVGPLYVVSCAVFIHNITESSFFRDQHTVWTLYLISVSIVAFSVKKFKEKNESRISP